MSYLKKNLPSCLQFSVSQPNLGIGGIFILALTLFASSPVFAQTFHLDSTFSFDGKAMYDLGSLNDIVWDAALQQDGRILLAGSGYASSSHCFAILRCNADGSLDSTFDEDGEWLFDFGTSEDIIRSIAIQDDHKILVAGYCHLPPSIYMAIARINPNGSLDSTFSANGTIVTTVGGYSGAATAVALQPDGKIIIAGYALVSNDIDFALARFLSDGSVDNTFGTNGLVFTDIGSNSDFILDMMLQPDGRILVSGLSNRHPTLARYLPDGTLDNTFSIDGLYVTPDQWTGLRNCLTLQPDQKILVAGGLNNDFGILRTHPDGSLDSSFSGDGLLATDIAGHSDGAVAVTVLTNGNILLSGQAYDSSLSCNFATVQYLPNGNIDSSFADNGILITDFANDYDLLSGQLIQPDGKIILAGDATNANGADFGIARYATGNEPMAIPNPDIRQQATLAPNPTSGKTRLCLQSDASFDIASFHLRFHNTLGQHQTVPIGPITRNGQNIQIEIAAESLPNGIYFYEVLLANQVMATGKLIRQE